LRTVLAFLIIAASLPALAADQTAPPPPPRFAVGAPTGLGRPHLCGHAYYPALALRLNQQGTATIGFTIQVDGHVRDIHIEKSSGYDLLDQASMLCAQNWTYKPATQNGKPIEVPWRANIAWKLMDTVIPPTERFFGSYRCAEHRSDPAGKTKPLPALAILSVDADGNVAQSTVTLSSGDAVFDAYVEQCTRQWRYNPATQDGNPVPDIVRALVAWGGAAPPHDTVPVLADADDDCTRYSLPAAPSPARLEFTVETDGNLSNVRLVDTSGDSGYDAYLAACVAKWKYHPAIMTGRPFRTEWQAIVIWKSAP
jgi:TonB family protein